MPVTSVVHQGVLMSKMDLKRDLPDLYRPSAREVVMVDVPRMNFLMVDGAGDPNVAPAYTEAVAALFSLAFALKFEVKKGPLAIDYSVMPLEGLWWAEDMSSFATGDRSAWLWTMMIMQPDFITPEMVDEVAAVVHSKKAPVGLSKVRFEAFEEGLAAQIMHLGPFSEEESTIERVHDFIAGSGYSRSGKHHEIYLSDIRKAHPSKWKTIIRQPVA